MAAEGVYEHYMWVHYCGQSPPNTLNLLTMSLLFAHGARECRRISSRLESEPLMWWTWILSCSQWKHAPTKTHMAFDYKWVLTRVHQHSNTSQWKEWMLQELCLSFFSYCNYLPGQLFWNPVSSKISTKAELDKLEPIPRVEIWRAGAQTFITVLWHTSKEF